MLKRKAATVFLCFIFLLAAFIPAANAEAEGFNIQIAVDELNVRSGPGLSYPILGKASRGEEYQLLGQENEWQQISFKGEQGWVADWLVTSANSSSSSSSDSAWSGQATITEDGLRVRSGPGTDNSVIGTVHQGESYRIEKSNGEWTQLETPYGLGWVFNDYLQLDSNDVSNDIEESSGDEKTGTITGSSVNIRSDSTTGSEILGKLEQGSTVKILSKKNGWVEISFSGQSAWVSSDYVEAGTGSSTAGTTSNKLTTGNTGLIKADSLIVRDTPSLNGSKIGNVTKGQSFTMLEESHDWVKIEFEEGSYGWVAGWFLEKQNAGSAQTVNKSLSGSTVSIIHDGTNIRASTSTSSAVVERAHAGQVFEAISLKNDWYEIKLNDGSTGFVAGWIVTINGQAPQIEKRGSGNTVKNKTIVIDPGHGGRDNGTTGTRGTLEKKLNLQTAQLLADKLKAAGANVILTRNTDTYIPLETRVRSSSVNGADAFISIHYDSINDRSVRGMTTYYYHGFQESLARDVHASTAARTRLKDRGHRQGDYYVLRENSQKAILIELGYLSNPTEEMAVSSPQYQEAAATGMYEGLVNYFK
ncbi:SH3 domain-containing protein [Cytobacillus gottheilii]|uniref:SH3 domain-containing protein n=1 Tax=Cytobacillus gottheilii TaxID=859144 RepID=UPI0009B9794D|nr:SH3 domain-containing protein [Cytobacillus gottheilii]